MHSPFRDIEFAIRCRLPPDTPTIDIRYIYNAIEQVATSKAIPFQLSESVIQKKINAFTDKYVSGVPAELILGRTEFMGLDFIVRRKVLLPRPETELLVEQVIAYLRTANTPTRVIELGCGSGVIACSIAHFIAAADVHTWDISRTATALCEQNIRHRGLQNVTVYNGSFFSYSHTPTPHPTIIVSNPPYIPAGSIATLSSSVLQNDPIRALNGGRDGLAFHRRLIGMARAFSWPLFLEIGYDQAHSIRQLARATDISCEIKKDYAGHDRIAILFP